MLKLSMRKFAIFSTREKQVRKLRNAVNDCVMLVHRHLKTYHTVSNQLKLKQLEHNVFSLALQLGKSKQKQPFQSILTFH